MTEMLKTEIPKVLDELSNVFTKTIVPALADAGLQPNDRLVLVPDDIFGFLPLHAVRLAESTRLGDRFEVVYTRSLSILQQCLIRERPEPSKLFTIVDPTNTLYGPALDAALAARHFESANQTNEIDHKRLLHEAQDAHVFYWTGHSQFCLPVPYWSGLLLRKSGKREAETKSGQKKNITYSVAPKDLATFTDIDCGLKMDACTLAIIGGCQSGLVISGSGNESISLVEAFLNAGAKCVLASLWPVDDGACVLTMNRFFKAWREEGQTIAAALKTAQQWLRNLTAQELVQWTETCPELQRPEFEAVKDAIWLPAQKAVDAKEPNRRLYDHPYYWAPFVAVGQSWKDAE